MADRLNDGKEAQGTARFVGGGGGSLGEGEGPPSQNNVFGRAFLNFIGG